VTLQFEKNRSQVVQCFREFTLGLNGLFKASLCTRVITLIAEDISQIVVCFSKPGPDFQRGSQRG